MWEETAMRDTSDRKLFSPKEYVSYVLIFLCFNRSFCENEEHVFYNFNFFYYDLPLKEKYRYQVLQIKYLSLYIPWSI